MKGRLIRAAPEWFTLQEALRAQGVRASQAELTRGLAEFVKAENLTPLLVQRAKRRNRGLFI